MERRASPPGNHNTGRATRPSLHSRWSCHSHSDCGAAKSVCAIAVPGTKQCYPWVRFHKLSEGKEMRLTLGRKLGLGFGVILGLIVVDTTLTYLQANAIKMQQDRAMGVSMPTLETCRNLQKDLNQTQSKGRQVLLAGKETARRESAKKLFNEAWGDIGKDMARMDELAAQCA